MPEITAKLSTALADRYKIERHLGEGGMATVYLAEDLNTVVRPTIGEFTSRAPRLSRCSKSCWTC